MHGVKMEFLALIFPFIAHWLQICLLIWQISRFVYLFDKFPDLFIYLTNFQIFLFIWQISYV